MFCIYRLINIKGFTQGSSSVLDTSCRVFAAHHRLWRGVYTHTHALVYKHTQTHQSVMGNKTMKKGGCFVPCAALSQLTLKWTAALGDSEVWLHLRAGCGCQGPAYCLMTDTLLHPSPCHSQGTRQGKALITSLTHKHTHFFHSSWWWTLVFALLKGQFT